MGIVSALRATWLAVGLTAAAVPAGAELHPEFGVLLAEAGMSFRCDEGYHDVVPQPNDVFPYERAIRTGDDLMEVRFAIRPLSRITIDYEDPHNAAPEPEHLFPLLFQSLTERLSGGGHSPHREYPAEQARSLFGADWAAASVFDVVPGFGASFSQALLVAIHGNGKADAYTVFLFDDYETVKGVIDDALSCLSFVSPDTAAAVTDNQEKSH